MELKEVSTYRVDLHLAGELSAIEQCCRRYCHEVGLCVTVQAQRFIYTGGQEDGARVGLVNYPRFPTTPELLWAKARELADRLLVAACQLSILLESSDRTVWISKRDESKDR